MNEPQPSFFVEYPCADRCQVEVDLVGAHPRLTFRQLMENADAQHRKRHEPPSTPVHDKVAAAFRAPV